MRKYLILSALASLGVFLQAGSANDQYECSYKYKVGDNNWVHSTDSATTRSLAKDSIGTFLDNKEAEANRAGQSFESAQLFCRDVLGD